MAVSKLGGTGVYRSSQSASLESIQGRNRQPTSGNEFMWGSPFGSSDSEPLEGKKRGKGKEVKQKSLDRVGNKAANARIKRNIEKL